MSNAALAQWSPDYDWTDSTGGWQKVQYTDDRPAAGILVNNGLWWRYNSTLTNAQRGRANIISKMLLCNDFLERRINVDRELNLLDEEGVFEALTNSPTCVSCHVDLDPLAANFWGTVSSFSIFARRTVLLSSRKRNALDRANWCRSGILWESHFILVRFG